MRWFFFFCGCLAVMALAGWAYSQNYKTRESIRRVNTLHHEIALERESISMLRAEWAYLNRPERLRDLVELNFEELHLMPLTPEQFGDMEQIAYPAPDVPAAELELSEASLTSVEEEVEQ